MTPWLHTIDYNYMYHYSSHVSAFWHGCSRPVIYNNLSVDTIESHWFTSCKICSSMAANYPSPPLVAMTSNRNCNKNSCWYSNHFASKDSYSPLSSESGQLSHTSTLPPTTAIPRRRVKILIYYSFSFFTFITMAAAQIGIHVPGPLTITFGKGWKI